MKLQKKHGSNLVFRIFSRLSQLCAYTQLYKVFSILLQGGQLSESIKTGRHIALLGLFCPFFWFALFSGADAATIMLHAAHSGIVFLIGVAVVLVGLKKQK